MARQIEFYFISLKIPDCNCVDGASLQASSDVSGPNGNETRLAVSKTLNPSAAESRMLCGDSLESDSTSQPCSLLGDPV